MAYFLSQNSLFNLIIKSQTSSSVKDEAQPADVTDLVFTQNDANIIIAALTNNVTLTYTHIFNPQNQEFKFNFYSAGGYFQGDKKTLEMKIFRVFDDEKFKKAQITDQNKLVGITKSELSQNTFKIDLNYKIEKKGWATDTAQRDSNKSKILKAIGLGTTTKHDDMLRIIKIMAFILFRERGQTGPLGSEELLQREYGVICWCIVNMCAAKGYKTGGNLLKLLQRTGYSNSKKQVSSQNDQAAVVAETATLKSAYPGSIQSLEFFVLAFFSGWVNEELSGYTNWDHVSSGIQGLSPFHLPKSAKNKPDPDNGSTKKFELYQVENKNEKLKDTNGNDITFNYKIDRKIDKTSLGDTFTFDGNSLFTLNAKNLDLGEGEEE